MKFQKIISDPSTEMPSGRTFGSEIATVATIAAHYTDNRAQMIIIVASARVIITSNSRPGEAIPRYVQLSQFRRLKTTVNNGARPASLEYRNRKLIDIYERLKSRS